MDRWEGRIKWLGEVRKGMKGVVGEGPGFKGADPDGGVPVIDDG